MRNPVERRRRLRDGTSWRTFMRLLRLDDLITSYTHGRHIAIPEKSVFRLISPLIVMWLLADCQLTIIPFIKTWGSSGSPREPQQWARLRRQNALLPESLGV